MKRNLLVVAFSIALFFAFLTARPSRPSAATLESCPISLTNPDGQSLALVKYDLRAAVHGALSLVEMEMTFRNPEARQMEGRFTYTLPPGATISRFAKDVNGKLMEGEVVERLRAQAIFTEILHTMRDPALLETDQGNRFSARVFPVPASGTVRLLLAFSQPLPMKNGVRKLTIPLAGLPKIGEFNFSAIGRPLESEVGTGVVLDKEEMLTDDLSAFSRHATEFTPTKDIELTFKAAADKPIRALKSGNFQMVQFLYNPPGVPGPEWTTPPDWSFYFDTSASGADTEAPRLQVIERLLTGMEPVVRKKNIEFSASAFDIDIAPICSLSFALSANALKIMPDVVYKLRSRHALGATNLEAALKDISAKARAAQKQTIFVLVSDGIATWGARETKDLLAALGDWPAQHTLHALVIGNKQDEKTLKAITEKTHGRIVTLPLSTDVEGNVAKAIEDLRAPLGAHFDAYDEGTAWIYPKSFHDVRPGTEMIAFSEIKPGGKSLPGFVQRDTNGKTIKDTQVPIAPAEVADFAPLLQREAYKAYLDFLEKEEQNEKDAMKRAELHKKRIDISVKNRVMCPLTSLLVLETENDYRRFGIERTALADVMVVGKSGIELRKRAEDEVPITPRLAVKLPREAAKDGKESPAQDKSKEAKHEESEAEKATAAPSRPLAPRGALKDREGRDGAELDIANKRLNARMRSLDDGESVDALREQAQGVRLQMEDSLSRATVTAGRTLSASAATAAAPQPNNADAARPDVRLPEPLPGSTPARDMQRADRLAPSGGAVPEERAAAAAHDVTAGQIIITRPEWIQQANELATDAQLNDLRAKIQGNPRDRKLRNAYADALLKANKFDNLQAEVFQWLPFDPENPAVYEYLGKSATGLNDPALALRAYSSIAEIAPNRAALLCRAGFLLLAAKKYDLAEGMFREALKNRQDDANIHRGLAMSLWLAGNYEGASVAIETALMRDFHPRYGDVKRVLREEFAYVLRAWQKKNPGSSDAIVARAQRANVDLLRSDALRVTMCWETDANDVDLHVVDPNGEECFYNHKQNVSGLELYSDQTQGLGPEVIRTDKALTGTYQVGVNYFSAGPMGVSRGVVVVLKPVDGVDENPQVIPFALIEGGRDMRFVGSVNY